MHRHAIAVLTAVLASVPVLADELIPVEDFFRFNEFSQPQLSPSGEYLAIIHQNEEGARNLVVMDLDESAAHAVTSFEVGGVGAFLWLTEERLMFSGQADTEAAGARAGATVGVYTINRDSSDARQLEHLDNRFAGIADRVLDDPDVIIGYGADNRGYSDMVRVNARTGRSVGYEENPHQFFEWYLDQDGVARAATNHIVGERRFQLMYRDDADSEWRVVMEYDAEFLDDRDLHVHGFDVDNLHLLVRSRIGRDRYAAYRLNPETGELGEPIAEDPTFDIDTIVFTNAVHEGGRPAYAWSAADVPRKWYIDRDWGEIQAMVDGAFPETYNSIVDANLEETRFIVSARNSQIPTKYYLLDLEAGRVKYLVDSRGWIDPTEMGEQRPIVYAARDGLEIHGYLTLPAGYQDGDRVPLIINPHGGPYDVRDDWGWSQEPQFFASRGWAVLQPNFRGSGGRGKAFQVNAYQQWGLEMQDDITDAVHWAIEQGYADPDRICIYGASYGGYATLMGLIETPDLFQCGVNYVGVTSLYDIYEDDTRISANGIRDTFMIETMIDYLGVPGDNEARYRQTSPIYRVAEIEDPIFVIHGRLDRRVQVDQYYRLLRELDAQDKEYQSLLREWEGHGFLSRDNARELYGQMEEFLGRYLN